MPRPRELKITLKPVQLTLCIALGLWLGALAIALSLWLAWRLMPERVQPLSQVLVPPAAAPAADPQSQMFEQYKQILHKQQAQQAEDQAEGNLRNLANPKCQFWLQQNRTAPTEKSRALVLEFCN